MTRIRHVISSLFVRDEGGWGLAEYGLVLALFAIVAIVTLIFVGGQIRTVLGAGGRSI